MIPKSTFMAGLDKYNRAVQSSLTAGLVESLPTVGSVFDNSLWYELDNDTPVLKFRRGNVDCTKRPNKKLHKNLAVWLRFDESTTKDELGNTWAAFKAPTIGTTGAVSGKALQLNGSAGQYLRRTEKFNFHGQPFTISMFYRSNTSDTGRTHNFCQLYLNSNNRLQFGVSGGKQLELHSVLNGVGGNLGKNAEIPLLDGNIHHIEADFKDGTGYIFFDGVLVGSNSRDFSGVSFECTMAVGYNLANGSGVYLTGAIDEFQFYDGVVLHTSDFTPPTASDYL